MHFSIPDTISVKETNSHSYVAYKVYINGVWHCNMRYSHLYTLNDQLKLEYGQDALPTFPPKKFFNLSKKQLEQRRFGLEKYLQRIGQNVDLVNSPILRKFLLITQTNTFTRWYNEETVTVWLLDNSQVVVKSSITDSSQDILRRACEKLRVSNDLVHHFSLFIQALSESHEDGGFVYLLQDFQNPSLTLKNMSGSNRIVLRKSSWEITDDLKLLTDSRLLNLLYIQAVFDVESGWISADASTREKLYELQSKGIKREFMEIARTLKFYGYLRFHNCICDYPEPGTEVILSVGFNDFIVSVVKSDNEEITGIEYSFKIVRIRSWKITHMMDVGDDRVQLSFEYLLAKDRLHWITIISEYAYLASVCLQAIVDELMLKRAASLSNKNHVVYHKESDTQSSINKSKETSIVSLKSPYSVSFIANASFENIGDDDL